MFVGIGGVGGYVGGAFADTFDDVTFIARNQRLQDIGQNGLRVVSDIRGTFTVHPAFVTDCPEKAGIQDYIFVCVKNYSLDEVCRQIAPAVDEHTVIVPIMNGVDPGDVIRRNLGKGIVLDSLIYIVTSLEKDGSIRQMDEYAEVHLGKMNPSREETSAISAVRQLFDEADIRCIVESDIEAAIWEKYIFNCAYNVATARYLCNAGEIREDAERMEDFIALLREAYHLGEALGVHVQEQWLISHEERMRSVVSSAATSSLKRDMEAGRQSELETFSGYVVREASKKGVEVPVSIRYYESMRKK
jgi:2-dehydropantoate 2-reductase